jgi:hypothetical protein
VARYDTLANHYQTIFTLMQEHHWSWGDIQNMIPFERDIYLILLKQWVDKKNEEITRQNQSRQFR